jgi:hypothetical protein
MPLAPLTGTGSFALRIAVGAAFLLAAGAPARSAWAGAGGLIGTYEGKIVCSGLENGTALEEKTRVTAENPVVVSDTSGILVIGFPGVGPFRVFVEENAQKPGQSLVGGINCPFSLALSPAGMVLLTAKVKGENVTLKGTLQVVNDTQNAIASCKLSVKRVDAADPIFSCPE